MNIVSGKAPNAEKGKRYIGLLDQALCDGHWAEVPELARKVDKHAPERKCLTLTARSEAQLAAVSHRPSSSSASSTSAPPSFGEVISRLTATIDAEKAFQDDVYCARTALVEAHLASNDPAAAWKALPSGSSPVHSRAQGIPVLGWLEVCAIKALCLRAEVSEKLGRDDDARNVYHIASSQASGSRTPELRRWTEKLLSRACTYGIREFRQESTLQSINYAYRCFGAWTSFWQRIPTPNAARIDTSRRRIWKAYYELLSLALQRGLVYSSIGEYGENVLSVPQRDNAGDGSTNSKARQFAELKRAEATYESLLLNETQFPQASQSNTEVEDWAELAMGNWLVLCGPGWKDDQLGDGGKQGVSRGMLDMLYRAATKTFHSTAILRQLFTVHSAIGEFELAMHAFKSYEEIVSKGKARAAKTGKHELGFDDDDVAIRTAADAVRVLCKYGDREQAEQALKVGSTIQLWLEQQKPTSAIAVNATSDDHSAVSTATQSHATAAQLQSRSQAAARRAIGVSQAHWAHLTYEAEARPKLLADAVENLQQAVKHDPTDIETAFSLAVLLAEMRDVPAGIDVIKRCIARSAHPNATNGSVERSVETTNRRLIPLWHLLAVCLAAKDDYQSAAKMCEAAFEQFNPADLFGRAPERSQIDPEKFQAPENTVRGIVDHMDLYEKECLLQIRFTQLTLIELTEGAGVAVDSTDELLSLYTRLFGRDESLQEAAKPAKTPISAPSRAGGTLRSMTGSIRPRSNRNSVERDAIKFPQTSAKPTAPRTSLGSSGGRPPASDATIDGGPVAITITNEEGVSSSNAAYRHHHHSHLPFRSEHHHEHHTELSNSRTRDSAGSATGASGLESNHIGIVRKGQSDEPTTTGSAKPVEPAITHSMSQDVPTSPEQPLREVVHSGQHDQLPPPTGHEKQPPRQDVRLPAPHPASTEGTETHWASLLERQHILSLLVSVWLFISGLYLRADLYDDAKGAVAEALRLVESIEREKGPEHSSASNFFNKGWGGGRSVDKLWADVLASRGNLASARNLPYEAMSDYEQALAHYPDHPQAIIGVSGVLMDIYEKKLPAEEPKPLLEPLPAALGSLIAIPASVPRPGTANSSITNATSAARATSRSRDAPTPAELNRLAARDRAYMLLSNLTRLGSGWDNAEAWYTLARAYELSNQMTKAKEALWWVVELEDSKPIRPWRELVPGGYTL